MRHGQAALEAVFVAEHLKEFAGVRARGAQVRLPYTVAYDLADDHITALRAYLSMAALRGQLEAQALAPTG